MLHRVFELRQYSLRPGRRAQLVELFEREFIESQEALGIGLPGQFLDLDDPDRFVWLRSFADMSSRAVALAAFYDGPVWRAHRDAANATMIDSDDVLLLRPQHPLALPALRPGATAQPPAGALTAVVCAVDPLRASALATRFGREVEPVLRRHGATLIARFLSESARNNFPRLPVREGETVFVWLAAFPDTRAQRLHHARWPRLASVQAWFDDLGSRPQVLRLRPTPRSLLRGLASPRAGAAPSGLPPSRAAAKRSTT